VHAAADLVARTAFEMQRAAYPVGKDTDLAQQQR